MDTHILNARTGSRGRHAPCPGWIALVLLLALGGCERSPPPTASVAPPSATVVPSTAAPAVAPVAVAPDVAPPVPDPYGAPVPAPAGIADAPAPPPAASSPSAAVPSPPPSLASASPGALPPAASSAPTGASALPPTDLPPGPIYACEIGGVRTPMAFPDSVEPLCRRHPEMGPCQYERNACRQRGGRVYTSTGVEVTMATEAAYDQRVQRVKLH